MAIASGRPTSSVGLSTEAPVSTIEMSKTLFLALMLAFGPVVSAMRAALPLRSTGKVVCHQPAERVGDRSTCELIMSDTES